MKTNGIITAEAEQPQDQSPPVPWWSFTKTVLAAAALRLVDQGKVELDARVAGAPYTLRHLLQHRSGLPDYGPLPEYHAAVAAQEEPWTFEELLRRAGADTLLFAPGSALSWAYSNIGYLMVRQIIERATDRPLSDALDTLLFTPFGIADTSVAASVPDWERTLHPHRHRRYHPGWVYHGLVTGPLSSAATFLHRLLFSGWISQRLMVEMLTPVPLGEPPPGRPGSAPGYGLGVMVDVGSPLGPVVGHTGQGPGSTIAVYSFTGRAKPRTLAGFLLDDGPDAQGVLETYLYGIA